MAKRKFTNFLPRPKPRQRRHRPGGNRTGGNRQGGRSNTRPANRSGNSNRGTRS